MIFFNYQRLSLQAVLFLVPKNVSESCITNDTCQVECIESSQILFILINIKHMWIHSGEGIVQNAEILSPGNLK